MIKTTRTAISFVLSFAMMLSTVPGQALAEAVEGLGGAPEEELVLEEQNSSEGEKIVDVEAIREETDLEEVADAEESLGEAPTEELSEQAEIVDSLSVQDDQNYVVTFPFGADGPFLYHTTHEPDPVLADLEVEFNGRPATEFDPTQYLPDQDVTITDETSCAEVVKAKFRWAGLPNGGGKFDIYEYVTDPYAVSDEYEDAVGNVVIDYVRYYQEAFTWKGAGLDGYLLAIYTFKHVYHLIVEPAIIASGTWGECDWSVDTTGLLHVYPTNGVSGQLADSMGERSGADQNGRFFPWHEYRDNVTSVVIDEGVSLPQNCEGLLYGSNITSLDASGWDVSSVRNMRHMFGCCYSLTTLDASGWDTARVTDMSGLFINCRGLTNLNVSRWDTSSVTNMSGMFSSCNSLSSLDVSSWNTTCVTDMSSVFWCCTSLTSLDVSAWSTTHVTDMSYAFGGCSSLAVLDLSGWDTSSVTNTGMSQIFGNGAGISSIKVGAGCGQNLLSWLPAGTWRSTETGQAYTVNELASSRAGLPDTYMLTTDISGATIVVADQTYAAKALEPAVTVTLDGEELRSGTDYTLSYQNNKNVGTATVIVTGEGNYAGTAVSTFEITKAANPLTAKATKPSVSRFYRPNAAIATAGNVTVSKARGTVTYANASTDATAKGFAVNRSSGRVTVPKATKAGIYVFRVRVTAAGNANYKSGSKIVSYKIAIIKAANPLTARAVTRTASSSALKSGPVTVARPLAVSGAVGSTTYVRAQNSSYFTVNRPTGRVNVKRGTPKGTYTLKIRVTAAGNANYKACSKTVTCKIVVK